MIRLKIMMTHLRIRLKIMMIHLKIMMILYSWRNNCYNLLDEAKKQEEQARTFQISNPDDGNSKCTVEPL